MFEGLNRLSCDDVVVQSVPLLQSSEEKTVLVNSRLWSFVARERVYAEASGIDI